LRASLNLPMLFSTWHGQRELLAGYQYLMATRDGGSTWTKLGPDLTQTRAHPAPSDTTIPRCACIWSIAASTVRPGVIWIGVINGIVQVSRNHGVTWNDVTSPDIGVGLRVTPTWAEASPFDAGTAYTAFNLLYRGDVAPHLYRPRGYRKTWTTLVAGLPATSPGAASVHVVGAERQRRSRLSA